jgi:excinuclease ABC subunit C
VSLLDDIPGVGPERRRRILRAFGSVRRVSEATVADLAAVPGIGPELARAVYETLRNAADGRQGGGENAEPLPMETEPEPTPTVPESEVVRNGR